MKEVEKEGVGKAKVGLIVSVVLVVILAISSGWLYTRVDALQNQINTLPSAVSPEEKAKAMIIAYVVDAVWIPEWRVGIDKVELRPPTKEEVRIYAQHGEKTPKIIWFASVTIFYENLGSGANTI
jgi:hypothetical protein